MRASFFADLRCARMWGLASLGDWLSVQPAQQALWGNLFNNNCCDLARHDCDNCVVQQAETQALVKIGRSIFCP